MAVFSGSIEVILFNIKLASRILDLTSLYFPFTENPILNIFCSVIKLTTWFLIPRSIALNPTSILLLLTFYFKNIANVFNMVVGLKGPSSIYLNLKEVEYSYSPVSGFFSLSSLFFNTIVRILYRIFCISLTIRFFLT